MSRQIDPEWTELLLREHEIHAKLCREPNVTREMVMGWWKAVTAVLNAYQLRLHRYANAEGPLPPPMTMDFTQRLCSLTGELAVGNIPDPVRAAVGRGSPTPGPTEARCIRLAVAYVQACKQRGLNVGRDVTVHINDRAPVRSICRWFGVRRTTVQGWVKNHKPTDFNGSPPRRTSNDEGDSPDLSVEARGLLFRVREAGKNYQLVSRSSTAITERAVKKANNRKPKVRSPSRG